MLDRMQVSNTLTIAMDKAHVLDRILGYCLGSVSYMSAKVVIQFSPTPGGGIKLKGDSRISKFDSKRRRSGGRGRGCRRGRGSHRGHDYKSNRNDPANG